LHLFSVKPLFYIGTGSLEDVYHTKDRFLSIVGLSILKTWEVFEKLCHQWTQMDETLLLGDPIKLYKFCVQLGKLTITCVANV